MINKIHYEPKWKSNYLQQQRSCGYQTGRGSGGGCLKGHCVSSGYQLWDTYIADESAGRGLGCGHHNGAGKANGIALEYDVPAYEEEG